MSTKEMDPSSLDGLNGLLLAGFKMFSAIRASLTPAQDDALVRQITVEGWQVRMIVEEATVIVQLYREDKVHELARLRGHDPQLLN